MTRDELIEKLRAMPENCEVRIKIGALSNRITIVHFDRKIMDGGEAGPFEDCTITLSAKSLLS